MIGPQVPAFSRKVVERNTPPETAQEATVRAGEKADQDRVREATRIVRALCETIPKFTADDVWERLDPLDESTPEPRALAAVLRTRRAGWLKSLTLGEHSELEAEVLHTRHRDIRRHLDI